MKDSDKQIAEDIMAEVRRQRQINYKDDQNTPGLWTTYIANYVSRWAMPFTFDTDKYNFRRCMVIVAALAFSAIDWYDNQSQEHDEVDAALRAVEGCDRND